MGILILGLLLFFAPHVVPMLPALRTRIVARTGEQPFKGLFSLVAGVGLALIVWGKPSAPFVHVYTPLPAARGIALIGVPLALVLLAAAYLPNNLRRFVGHPMLAGVALWALMHLLVNGDLASLLLFGTFGGFAVADVISSEKRGTRKQTPRVSIAWDFAVVVVGLGVAALVLRFHAVLFRVPAY